VSFQLPRVRFSIFLGPTLVFDLGAAATGSAWSAVPAGTGATKLLRKFWNLALYCSNGLSAAAASSGSARIAVAEKRILLDVKATVFVGVAVLMAPRRAEGLRSLEQAGLATQRSENSNKGVPELDDVRREGSG